VVEVTLKEYIQKGYDTAEGLSKKIGKSRTYLQYHAISQGIAPPLHICVRIEKETGGLVKRWEIVDKNYYVLIDGKGAIRTVSDSLQTINRLKEHTDLVEVYRETKIGKQGEL
jgi:hypothetical protein